MADSTMLVLPVATAVDGSEYAWISQTGTDKRVALGLIMAGSASASVQAANTIFAGPESGPAAAPTFRALVAADFAGAIWTVSQGGTGLSSLTEYALLAGGTTPTGNAQQVSGVGTSGQVLTSNGAGFLPTWQPTAAPTGAALTRVDDTNVTLTLGGTPATALLQATSITAGWSGQLAVTRGGTGLGSLNQGDIIYGSAANTFSALAKSTSATRYIANTGTSNNPAWAQVDLTNGVTGTLPAANGGTGVTSLGTITKTDDTNVTLTLGGTPANSTIQSVSFTLGWTGTLAVSRGGTGLSATAAGTVLASLSANTISATVSPVLGAIGGGTGTLGFSGNTSGTVTVQPQAAAGTWNFNLPTTAGSAGQVLTSQGGGSTAMTWETVAGTGTVTSITPGLGLTSTLTATAPGSAITVSGTLYTAQMVNAQTGTTYTILDADRAKLVTHTNGSSIAVTLPQAGASSEFQAGWYYATQNRGAGLVTITPTTSTIDGAASLTIPTGQGCQIFSDGTNYFTARGRPTGVLVSQGGTGLATLTSNTVYKGAGTSAMATSSIVDDGTTVTTTLPVVTPNAASGYTTTATAAGTTTLTVASTRFQYFTGSTTQTVTLPVTSTLYTGLTYTITNNSTGVVTVQSSGANDVLVMGPQSTADFICILTSGTDASSWSVRSVYANIPQNSQSTAYTTVLSDAGKHILHPTGDNNARTFTIDSNANVPYPIGTAITFINQINTVTIAITSDTLTLAGAGTTGSRTLAANGIATAIKITSTLWFISGTGLT